jgi:hypothetical protein
MFDHLALKFGCGGNTRYERQAAKDVKQAVSEEFRSSASSETVGGGTLPRPLRHALRQVGRPVRSDVSGLRTMPEFLLNFPYVSLDKQRR